LLVEDLDPDFLDLVLGALEPLVQPIGGLKQDGDAADVRRRTF
jgi:hypothetical protein